jgi:cellulose synthase/poly-beta-1,6-N-acetylglucosamine synthase-like glycosyltransferase
MALLTVLGLAVLAVALPPALVLTLECLLALLPPPRTRWKLAPRLPLAVLVPAHDEEALLPRALRSVRAQLAAGDRLLVVAHNCRDATAQLARELGAEVIEARDAGARGKSDAVLAGLAHLARGVRPDVVVILDADGVLSRGGLDALARAVAFHGAAVQAEYVFRTPRGSRGRGDVSRYSTVLKNVVRPRGLHRLGLGCFVTGSGCAFPLPALRGVPQGEGAIAEDTQLALDLARRGTRCRFVPEARVTSELPLLPDHAARQHRRWEHGHLDLCLRSPRLLLEALGQRNADLATLALEVSVPPISILVAALGLASACFATALPAGLAHLGLEVALGVLAALSLALGATAARALGPREASRALLGLPAYLRWKLPVLAAYAADRERSWTRTPRGLQARRARASMSAAPSTGGSRST